MSQKKYYLCRRIDVEKANFDDAVLYPNPYMVITPQGYTKHYYAGTERLATVIGRGGFSDIITPIETLSSQEVNDIVNPFYTHYEHHTYDPFYYEDALNSDVVTEDVVGTQAEWQMRVPSMVMTTRS